MLKFTIETTYRMPVFRHRTYEAATAEEAFKMAIADDNWEGQKDDPESSGPAYLSGAWQGEDAAYRGPALAIPAEFSTEGSGGKSVNRIIPLPAYLANENILQELIAAARDCNAGQDAVTLPFITAAVDELEDRGAKPVAAEPAAPAMLDALMEIVRAIHPNTSGIPAGHFEAHIALSTAHLSASSLDWLSHNARKNANAEGGKISTLGETACGFFMHVPEDTHAFDYDMPEELSSLCNRIRAADFTYALFDCDAGVIDGWPTFEH